MKISKKRSLQRVLTAILSIAMIFTSLPVDMLAGVFGGVGKVQAAGETKELDIGALITAGTLNAGDKTVTKKIDDTYSLIAIKEVKSGTQTFDSINYSGSLQCSTGSTSTNAIKITASKKGTLKMYVRGGSSSGSTITLEDLKGSKTIINDTALAQGVNETYTTSVDAGTYYLYTKNTTYFYCISLTEVEDASENDASENEVEYGTVTWTLTSLVTASVTTDTEYTGIADPENMSNRLKVITAKLQGSGVIAPNGSSWTTFKKGAQLIVPLGKGKNTITMVVYQPSESNVYKIGDQIITSGENLNGGKFKCVSNPIIVDDKESSVAITSPDGKDGYIVSVELKVEAAPAEEPEDIETFDNTADGIREISVWDFGAQQFSDDAEAKIKYTNHLTADIINNNFYPGQTVEAGKTGYMISNFDVKDSNDNTNISFNGAGKTNHRLRSTNTKLAVFDAKSLTDANKNNYTGYIYSNAGSTKSVFIHVPGSKYDIFTYYVGSNGNKETYEFTGESGIKQTGSYTAGSQIEKLTFIALEDGLQEIYGTDEKLVVARIVRETPDFVTLRGTVTGFNSIPSGAKLVFTPEYAAASDSSLELPSIKALINSDGSYSVTVPEQYTYNVTLEGTDEYVVAAAGSAVSVAGKVKFDLAAGAGDKNDFNITVEALDLVSVSGSLKAYESDGTTELADTVLANYIKTNASGILFEQPKEKIYVPKIKLNGSAFTLTLEKGVEYKLSTEMMDDFELVTKTFSASAAANDAVIKLKKLPVNNVNVVFTEYKKGYDYSNEAAEKKVTDVSVREITFKRIIVADHQFEADGYTYSFANADDVALREGQYQVSVAFGNSEYKQYLTKDAKVTANGATVYIPLQEDSPYAQDGTVSFIASNYGKTGEIPVAGGFTFTNMTYHDNQHGISGGANSGFTLALSREADVTIQACKHGEIGKGNKDASVNASSGELAITKETADPVIMIKGAAAGNLTVTFSKTEYVHSVKVTYKGEAPEDENVVKYSPEITVGSGKDYSTINDALDAVRAMGERTADQRVTIAIDPGTYDEMLRVDTPYVTLKNASATPSIAFKNAGVDVDADAVRITSYYGVGYNYYSMDSNYLYNADVLAVNTHNGYYTTENPGGGGTGDMWNATVWVSADGFEADGIIFENSFNQYIPEKEVADTHVKQGGAKEGSVTREAMKAGDTAVQQKAYVERAAALAFSANVNANLNKCAVISHQDTLYGGVGAKINFKDNALYGGTDYIFGGMNAVFDHCDLILQVSNDKNDQAYITAVQSNATPAYLFYYCTVKNTDSNVMNADYINGGSKPGYWGRAWSGKQNEVLFYNTTVEDSKDATVYTNDGGNKDIYGEATSATSFTGDSLIRPRGWRTGLSDVSDSRFMEYGTVESIDGSASRKPPVSEKNVAKFTFEGKEIALPLVVTAEQLAAYMGIDLDSIMTDGAVDSEKLDKKVGEYFGFDLEPEEKQVLPTVSFTTAPTLSGNTSAPAVGDTLTVTYSLGEENDANDASVIKWYRVKDGEETLIKEADASDKSYTIAAEDEGCTLKVVVTPFLADGTTGEAAEVTLDVVISAAGDDDDKKDDDEKKTDDEDKDPEVPAGFVSNIAKISVPNNNVLLVPGQKTSIVAAFTAAVADKTVDAKYVVWKSSNKNVVTVDNNGNIVAVGAGKAVITVTSLDNGVTVSFPVEVGAEDTLYAGSDITLQLKESKNIEVTYGGHVIYGAKFESNASKIVKVDKTTGRVTAKKLGSAVINVTYNGKTAIVRVTVEDAAAAAETADASYNNTNKLAKKVIKAPTTVKLKIDAKGKKLQKTVKVSGKGVLKGGVIDASVNDARIATVTKRGDKFEVKAVNSGATYITWTVKNGNYIAKKVTKVIVDRAAVAGELKLSSRDASGNLVDLNGKAEASLNKTDASANDASGNAVDASVNHLLKGGEVFTLPVGAGLKLNAYLPEGITDKSVVKWKSNNSAVKITKQGYLVVVKASAKPAVITAKVGKVTATFTVNVSGGSFSFKKAGATLSVKNGKAKTVKLATTSVPAKCEIVGSPAGVTASIVKGKVNVTATKAGTYFVKAYDANGNSSIAEIFVPQK